MLLMMLFASAAVQSAALEPANAGKCVILVSRPATAADGGAILGVLPGKTMPAPEPAVQSRGCKSDAPGTPKRRKNERLS